MTIEYKIEIRNVSMFITKSLEIEYPFILIKYAPRAFWFIVDLKSYLYWMYISAHCILK